MWKPWCCMYFTPLPMATSPLPHKEIPLYNNNNIHGIIIMRIILTISSDVDCDCSLFAYDHKCFIGCKHCHIEYPVASIIWYLNLHFLCSCHVDSQIIDGWAIISTTEANDAIPRWRFPGSCVHRQGKRVSSLRNYNFLDSKFNSIGYRIKIIVVR